MQAGQSLCCLHATVRIVTRSICLSGHLMLQNGFNNKVKNDILLFVIFNSTLASSNFCCQLKTFANCLDQDQDRQSAGPDLGPSILTL